MNTLHPAGGREPSVRVVARYSGMQSDNLRNALLSPQLDISAVEVHGVTFEITCRTRAAAANLMMMFESLSLTIERFNVE